MKLIVHDDLTGGKMVTFPGLQAFGYGKTTQEAYVDLMTKINKWIHIAQAVEDIVRRFKPEGD